MPFLSKSSVVSTLVLGTALIAIAATTGASGSSAGDSSCVVPDPDPLAENAKPIGDHLDYQQWLVDGQPGVELLGDAIQERFGEPGSLHALDGGLIGLASDHYAQRMNVVVDPTILAVDALQMDLDKSLADTKLDVKVIAGCNSAPSLRSAGEYLATGAWDREAPSASHTVELDAATSRWEISVSGNGLAAATALARDYAPLISVTEDSTIARTSRERDSEPHKGGAGIRSTFDLDNVCTSAFTARMPTGAVGSVSAGHCFSDQDNIRSGPVTDSVLYGSAVGESNYPTFDMIRIAPSGEDFVRKLWANPPAEKIEDVHGDQNPDVGELVCLSGKDTLRICGVEVKTLNATLSDADGDTPNLFRARKDGLVIIRDGDSGGPVYNNLNEGDVGIRGMMIGGSAFDTNVLAHKVSTIKSHLNVTDIGM